MNHPITPCPSSESPESSSIEAFFRDFAPQGRKYALAMVGNGTDADEVVQEAFLKILNANESGELPAHFQPLFFTSIRNLCIDMIRKRKTNRSLPLDQVGELAANQEVAGESAHSAERSMELLLQRLPELLRTMPAQWAAALTARLEKSKTYAEIANEMNATHHQVRTWIFRARQFLRKELKAKGNIQG